MLTEKGYLRVAFFVCDQMVPVCVKKMLQCGDVMFQSVAIGELRREDGRPSLPSNERDLRAPVANDIENFCDL